jgi:ATP phosphoribosyltransferase
MNVPARALKRVMSLLSSMHSPTISTLSDPDWFALEVMINEKLVRELIPKLKMAGAQGIVEYQLNKVIP